MFDFLDDALDGAKSAATSAREWLSKPTAVPDALGGAVSAVSETLGDASAGFAQEGVAGLLDPIGMMDRQDAKRDLAPYFGIVEEDFVGPRNHNQISQDELDSLARTYSDIRLGRGDISIDTRRMANDHEGDLYEEGVMKDIAMIMQTTSGREQIQKLNDNPTDFHTTIRPEFISFWDEEDRTFDHIKGGGGRAEKYDELDERITYKPGVEGNYGARGDVILAHELEHARLHMLDANAHDDFDGGPGHPDSPTTDPFTGDPVAVENSERQAVGLTNTDPLHPTNGDGCTENQYRYERNQIGDHLAPRTHYSGDMPGEEHDERKLAKLWDAFLGSADDAIYK